MNSPPTSWIGWGSSPSNSQANSTVNKTSERPTNDASLAPRIRAAKMPARYGVAAAIAPSSSTATHHGIEKPASSAGAVLNSIGSAPTRPTTPKPTAPTTKPLPASASGGSAASWDLPDIR
jgi:hypothetical protein